MMSSLWNRFLDRLMGGPLFQGWLLRREIARRAKCQHCGCLLGIDPHRQALLTAHAEVVKQRDDANKIASDAKFQNERLVREIGYATECLWSGESMSSQLKGMEVAIRDLTVTLFKVEKERDDLRALLRRSIQLPRPWMDGGITWEKWSTLFSDIERAISND